MILIKKKSTPTFPPFFDDFFTKELSNEGLQNFATNTTVPTVNLLENDTDFLVQMAAPGLNKKDFTIELNNEVLTISFSKEQKKEQKEKHLGNVAQISYPIM